MSFFDNDNILYSLSKDCNEGILFIQPIKIDGSIVEDIEKLNLNIGDLSKIKIGNIITETYDSNDEYKKRVDEFVQYIDKYYVSYWNKGEFKYSNNKNELQYI